MTNARTVKTSITLALLAALGAAPLLASAQPAPRPSEFVCTATDVQERLPLTVRLRITTAVEIEARALDKAGKESKSVLRRNESPDQTRAAVFMMGGQLGVSGDARMLIAQTALEFGEVGTIMIVNQSTRENLAYQCTRESAKEPLSKEPLLKEAVARSGNSKSLGTL